jgi:hypothetical protein
MGRLGRLFPYFAPIWICGPWDVTLECDRLQTLFVLH